MHFTKLGNFSAELTFLKPNLAFSEAGAEGEQHFPVQGGVS